MRVDIISIFPEMFDGPLSASILGIAQDRGILELAVHDLRDWTHDRHRTTDDAPYGGGPGMVMKPEPVSEALDAVQDADPRPGFTVFLTPSGRSLDQALVSQLAEKDRLILVCGRYEGFDERSLARADLELSIGDYVLTGGEIPAMVLVDAVTRLQPGALGDEQSSVEESFSEGLLEYPHYTRPATYQGAEVPDVLLSGDHGKIARWRRTQAILKTARSRPDLLARASLSAEEQLLADAVTRPDHTKEGLDE